MDRSPRTLNVAHLENGTSLPGSPDFSGAVYCGPNHRESQPQIRSPSTQGMSISAPVSSTQEKIPTQSGMDSNGFNSTTGMIEDLGTNIIDFFLTMLGWTVVVLTFPISLFVCFQVVKEYERAVIFRLGRLIPGGAKGPGLFFVFPFVQSFRKVDLRLVSFDVPPQEILSKDSVTVTVDAVVYYRISNATISVTNVEDANRSTHLLAQITLRNILGTKTLAEMLSDRENISHQMQVSLDAATEPWGVKVERVEVKDVRLPFQLQRAMAAEAEATREARAKVIAAEGEHKSSRALKEAADVLAASPAALQLRYLQTLSTVAAEHASTIVFPVPMDLMPFPSRNLGSGVPILNKNFLQRQHPLME